MDDKILEILENQNPWWFNKKFDIGINRLNYFPNLKKYINIKEILFLIGVRRTGKSTILYQIINKLIKKVNKKSILFLNLDEPYFKNQNRNPNLIINILKEYLVDNSNINKLYLFIDEIQTYKYWSESLKIIYDTFSNVKIIASGSSSNLIGSKLSLKLSGRYFYNIIKPLSFKEYLDFKNKKNITTIEKKKNFLEYLKYGGFPRVVLEKDKKFKFELLKNYFQTIYLKDIILPNKIRNNQEIFNLLYYLLSNIGVYFSYTSISKNLNLSIDTVQEYINYSINTYFIYNLNKYDYSLRKQFLNSKKNYCIDNGLINAISFKFSENKGRLLENLVFIELKRRGKEVYYHKNKKECDFVIKEGLKIKEAIQVTQSLNNIKTKKREILGLIDALKSYNLKEGLILTEDQEDTFIETDKKGNQYKIIVKPIWKYLLEE